MLAGREGTLIHCIVENMRKESYEMLLAAFLDFKPGGMIGGSATTVSAIPVLEVQ